jgi:adenine-specific DNA-methyltransferase
MSQRKSDSASGEEVHVSSKEFGLVFPFYASDDSSQYELYPLPKLDFCFPPKNNESEKHYLIRGENLFALKALMKSFESQVDLCIIDPPYNTGNTKKTGFTYKDSFRNVKDRERHSNWLSFMQERLLVAKELLSDSGVIAIHIDDKEVHYLRCLCDEIFGETNFVAQIVVDGGNVKNNARFISVGHEYLLVYAKNLIQLDKIVKRWRKKRDGIDLLLEKYHALSKEYGDDYDEISARLKKWSKNSGLSKRLKVFTSVDKRGLYTYADLSTPRNGEYYEVKHPISGKPCVIPSRGWGLSKEKLDELIDKDMIIFGKDETFQPLRKLYLKNEKDQVERSIVHYPARSSTHLLEHMLGRRNSFNNPKNIDFVKDMIDLMCPTDGIVLDFFAGSGTTGHAVLLLNEERPVSRRKFILVTNNENNIFDSVTLPRLKAAVSGAWADGNPHVPLKGSVHVFEVKESPASKK